MADDSGGGNTTWVPSADEVLATLAHLRCQAPLQDLNLYLGVSTAMTNHQANSRVQNATATGVLGFGSDIDLLNKRAHAGDQLPPDVASALALIDAFGLEWSLVVSSGHGLQPWLQPPRPWLWEQGDTVSRERAARLRQAIQLRLARLAEVQGYKLDVVQDHARLLRLPGTINRKKLRDGSGYLPMAPVTLVRVSAVRYSIEHLEDFLHVELAELKRLETDTPAKKSRATPGGGGGVGKKRQKASLTASDQELLEKILSAKGAEKFTTLWEGGSVLGDVSRDDASFMRLLAFWTNGDAAHMDRLFRCSRRMRAKYEQPHYAAGNEYGVRYGEHLIAKTLAEWLENGEGYMSEAVADVYPGWPTAAPPDASPDVSTDALAATQADMPVAGDESERAAGESSDAVRMTSKGASAGEGEHTKGEHTKGKDDDMEDDDGEAFSPFDDTFPYPDPPAPAAYYGLVGEYVARIAPHTESDPVALLGQLLTGFGAMLGRHSYFIAEDDEHYPNLYLGIVGRTSSARKGSSWGIVRRRLSMLDDAFALEHIQSGLATGEGLIHALRDIPPGDPIPPNEPLLADKRLLMIESEFVTTLKMFGREHNTLSDKLRQGWDGVPLQTKPKNAPERATKYHLAVIGHITQIELTRTLTETDSANGLVHNHATSSEIPRWGS